jgi:non-canonical purine NTP pyrophosphatase (RdgB/HAM1 family)
MELLVATTNAGKLREIRRALSDLPISLRTLDDFPQVGEAEETGRTFADNAHAKAIFYASRTGVTTVAEDSGLAIDALDGRPGVESARYPGPTYADKFLNLYRELSRHPRPWTARFVCSLALVGRAPGTGHWALADQALGTGHSALAEQALGTGHSALEEQAPGAGHSAPAEQALGTGHRARADQALGTGHSAPDVPASAESQAPSAHGPQVLFTCEGTVEGEIAPEPCGNHGFGYDPIFFYAPYGRTLGEVSDEEKLAVSHRGKAFRGLRAWLAAREDEPRT